MRDELHGPFVAQVIEKAKDVSIEHLVHPLPLNAHRQCIQRCGSSPRYPKTGSLDKKKGGD